MELALSTAPVPVVGKGVVIVGTDVIVVMPELVELVLLEPIELMPLGPVELALLELAESVRVVGSETTMLVLIAEVLDCI